jgi:hypothetical protein
MKIVGSWLMLMLMLLLYKDIMILPITIMTITIIIRCARRAEPTAFADLSLHVCFLTLLIATRNKDPREQLLVHGLCMLSSCWLFVVVCL